MLPALRPFLPKPGGHEASLKQGHGAAQRSRRCVCPMVTQAFVRAGDGSGLCAALDRGPATVGLETLPVACRELGEPRHHCRYAARPRVGEGTTAEGCKTGAE